MDAKPCPFCGNERVDTFATHTPHAYVHCQVCTGRSILSQWNTRPIEDALAARIAELEAQVQRLTMDLEYEQGEREAAEAALGKLPGENEDLRVALHAAEMRIHDYASGVAIQEMAARIGEMEAELEGDATCSYCELLADAQAEVADWRNSSAAVMAEPCGDEQHCTCVPLLRRRIAELDAQLAALQGIVTMPDGMRHA